MRKLADFLSNASPYGTVHSEQIDIFIKNKTQEMQKMISDLQRDKTMLIAEAERIVKTLDKEKNLSNTGSAFNLVSEKDGFKLRIWSTWNGTDSPDENWWKRKIESIARTKVIK